MTKYSNGVIYIIVCNSDKTLLYIGSTIHYNRRMTNHKYACNAVSDKKYSLKLYTMIRDNGGWDNFTISILKPYPCETKQQLCIEENRIMIEMEATMNGNKAYCVDTSTVSNKPNYNKQYYLANKDKIIQSVTNNYNNKKETINAIKREKNNV